MILSNFFKTHDKSFIRSISIVFLFVFIAKLFAATREIVLASNFGVGPIVDGFVFINNIILWPINLFGVVITGLFIPLVTEVRTRNVDDESILKSQFLIFTGLLSLIAVLVLLFIKSIFLENYFHQFLQNNSIYLGYFFSSFIYVIPFAFYSQLFSAWTMSNDRHINSIFEAFPPLFISFFVFISSTKESLALGYLGGFVMQCALLGLNLALHKEFVLPKFSFSRYYWSRLSSGFGLMLLSQLILSLTVFLDQFFALKLNEGILSIFSYADRISGIVLSLGSVVVGRAVMPLISKELMGNNGSIKNIFRWSTYLFFGSFILTAVFYFFSEEIVKFFFERGKFLPIHTKSVSNLIFISSFVFPFYIAGIIFSFSLIAKRQYKTVIFINSVNVLVKLFSLYIFFDFLGVKSLVLSNVLMYINSSIMCLYFFVKGIDKDYKLK